MAAIGQLVVQVPCPSTLSILVLPDLQTALTSKKKEIYGIQIISSE
jgi:hypothetical protein